MMRLRSIRSTNTPAIRPRTRLGAAVAINIKPTLAAEFVSRYTRIEAASDVSELPTVEISCPLHNKVKLRLRKIANGEGVIVSAAVAILSPLEILPRRHKGNKSNRVLVSLW
ncbi:MAG: hypothetical protein HY782_09195 [Chloroflexi bacterium]|nr:hypothetical protein [Chloroflexota bacterium]